MNKRGTDGLTRHELELHFQMPRDMIRVAPVLVLSALPFANYVVFPMAYIFPRKLLCRHFWSLQQRADFAAIDLRKRLFNQRPVLRCLQVIFVWKTTQNSFYQRVKIIDILLRALVAK
jgi:LETM1-like protein